MSWSSSLIFWLKADAQVYQTDGTTLCDTSSQQVGLWKDQSGNSYNVAASSGHYPVYVASAVNGKPGVSFTQSSAQYLETSGSIAHGIGTGNFLLAAVYQTKSSFGNISPPLFSIGAYAPAFYWMNSTSDEHFHFYLSSPGLSFSDVSPSTSTTYLTLCGRTSDPTTATIHAWSSEIGSTPSVSSSSTTDSASIATNPFYVGFDTASPDYMDGTICELMLFNAMLGSTDWNDLVSYLNDKYAGTSAPTTSSASILDL